MRHLECNNRGGFLVFENLCERERQIKEGKKGREREMEADRELDEQGAGE